MTTRFTMRNGLLDTDVFEFGGKLAGSSGIWTAVASVLGASLWAQLFWYPLATEFLSQSPGALYVGVYLLPTVALFVSVILRSSGGYLFFFPGSLIPGLVMLPQQDAAALLQFHRSIFATGTLLFFILAATLSVRGERGESAEREALSESEEKELEGVYRHYVSVRLAIMVVLFGVLVGAGLFDPSILGAISEHHAEGSLAAQLFIVVFGFFTWCVVAYTMFFLPLANLEYNVRRLSREIDNLGGGISSVRRRIGFLVVGGVAVAGALLFWQVSL